jgi:hypothetical protein
MSDHEKCPIEPDKAIRYVFGPDEDDYLLIAPSHDSIVMFPDPKYNHLRYFDAEEEAMRMVWLPAEALADLYDAGIPHTKRNSISQCEYEGYQSFLGAAALHGVGVEQLALEAGDPIDAEVQRATQAFEKEWDYLQDEDGWH